MTRARSTSTDETPTPESPWAVVPRARRIVVKVGTSTLTREGRLRPAKFTALARDVSRVIAGGRQVVLVSSGAIAVGAHRLGWSHAGESVRQKQAAAAVGQIGLVELYQRRFARHGHPVAQILLTRSGLQDRERFLNARHTMLELLRLGVVPIVNENDTVVTEEIRFGDNDNLAALVANLIDADVLVLLTDQAGLYTADPRYNSDAELVERRDAYDPLLDSMAGEGGKLGRGGMVTKVRAARVAARSGTETVIASGRSASVLGRIAAGDAEGTWLRTGQQPQNARKQWLASMLQVAGSLELDAGAVRVLRESGRSLLPVGVRAIHGAFARGDLVSMRSP